MSRLTKKVTTKATGTTLLKQTDTAFLRDKLVPVAVLKVQEGDTIFSLWQKYRTQTTVGAIQAVNGLHGNDLVAGKSIKVPLVL